VMRILDSKSDVDQKFVEDAPRLKEFLSKESMEVSNTPVNSLVKSSADRRTNIPNSVMMAFSMGWKLSVWPMKRTRDSSADS
jgi:hypothetical protein